MTNHEVWDKTIELNGVAIQSVVCMEECSELIKAISKRLRGELDIENNLAEEMADVTICLYQLARMYDVDDTDVHAWIDRKTERQRKRNALQMQLNLAVEAEHFEEAAKLRDELRALEQ